MRTRMATPCLLFTALIACGSSSAPVPSSSSSNTGSAKDATPSAPRSPAPPAAGSTSGPTPAQPSPALVAIEGAAIEPCAEPVEVDVPAGGLALVMHVDTTSLSRAHLSATAEALAVESPASLAIELAEGGAKIGDGWDVCVGQTQPSCRANLEMDPGIANRAFTLTVRPKSGLASHAKVGICVRNPLE